MCSPDLLECGLLHDEVKITLNDQIQLLSNFMAQFSMMLSEASLNIAADREAVKAKEQQKLDVDKA